jgi:hypothetical protein
LSWSSGSVESSWFSSCFCGRRFCGRDSSAGIILLLIMRPMLEPSHAMSFHPNDIARRNAAQLCAARDCLVLSAWRFLQDAGASAPVFRDTV